MPDPGCPIFVVPNAGEIAIQQMTDDIERAVKALVAGRSGPSRPLLLLIHGLIKFGMDGRAT